MFNVLGEPIDRPARSRPTSTTRSTARPRVRGAVDQDRGVRDRHQGHRPDRAVHQRRQGRPLRRRRRRQDGHHHGADPQHRQPSTAGYSVFAGVGERTREGNDLWRRDDRQLTASSSKTVHGLRPDERAAGRAPARRPDRPDDGRVLPRRGAATSCSSSTTSSASPRPARKCRRSSAACRAPWATSRPWPPRWASCRSGSPRPRRGSITSVQAVYVPADDYTDPAPATTFAHLDATIVAGAVDRRAGHLPGGRPAGLDLPHPRPADRRRGALRRRPRGAAGPAALQGSAGHHRHPRHRRAVRRGQA